MNGFPHDNKARGVYVGAVGGLPLFSSDTKFDSGAALLWLARPVAEHFQGRKQSRWEMRFDSLATQRLCKHLARRMSSACRDVYMVGACGRRYELTCMCGDAGTGWPSFYAPVDPEHVIEVCQAAC